MVLVGSIVIGGRSVAKTLHLKDMANNIQNNLGIVLEALYTMPREIINVKELQEKTELSVEELNDACNILEYNGYVELIRALGTYPYEFGAIQITSAGRFEYERATKQAEEKKNKKEAEPIQIYRHLNPVGSPYGFQEEDWETLSVRKSQVDILYVVFGFQFESKHFISASLIKEIELDFTEAVELYHKIPDAVQVSLNFKPLGAGYGEHLFNEIARDIISADIAVFDTSDLNPNVMLEMGVALTWGVRVLPIKKQGCPIPPSDISGQTWADYNDDGQIFIDTYHMEKLKRMVERAARKKTKK